MADQYKVKVEELKENVSEERQEDIRMTQKIQEAVDFLVSEAKLVDKKPEEKKEEKPEEKPAEQ